MWYGGSLLQGASACFIDDHQVLVLDIIWPTFGNFVACVVRGHMWPQDSFERVMRAWNDPETQKKIQIWFMFVEKSRTLIISQHLQSRCGDQTLGGFWGTQTLLYRGVSGQLFLSLVSFCVRSTQMRLYNSNHRVLVPGLPSSPAELQRDTSSPSLLTARKKK